MFLRASFVQPFKYERYKNQPNDYAKLVHF